VGQWRDSVRSRSEAWISDTGEAGPYAPTPAEPLAIALPLRLHADAVEELIDRLPPVVAPPSFDARHVRAAEPGAFLSLRLLAASHGVEPPPIPVPPDALVPPTSVADALGAAALFETIGAAPFLERASGWGWSQADGRKLASIVRELARNAVDHANSPAWVAAWRMGQGELRIAVADAGVGFGGSLGRRDEQDAILQALVHGATRSPECGRGDGLRRVGQLVARWGGRMRVRSGTALVDGTPPWHDAAVRSHLPHLPGVQVEVVLPCPTLRPARSAPPPAAPRT
jgi:hypothetical protein